MWICLNNAFVSVVQHTKDKLVVRARRKSHLTALFPDGKIIETMDRDYRFRIFVDRKEFAALIAEKIANIDYTNFKDSTKDKSLHDMYLNWWGDHYDLQLKDLDREEYNRYFKRKHK